MAKQTIGVGSTPNDGTGDPLRTAFIKINSNTDELYLDKHSHSNQAILDAITASYTTAEETKLSGIESGATADQTAGEIKTAYESNANTNAYTDAEKTKLGAIESGAEVNDVNSVNAQTGVVVLDADDISDAATVKKFTSAADISKLSGIEANATADQTNAEIKTAYEANADTNAYTDAEKTKLTGIETGADVTDATNVAAAGAVMNSDFTANGTMERTGAGAYETILNNRSAITDPGVGDDNVDGYAIGSRWINVTLDKEFVCLDVSTGAAVWKEVTGSGGAGSDTDAVHVNVAAEISGITEKATPVGTDLLIIEDSADSDNKKYVQIGNLPTAGGGEANTGANVGTAGVGVYKGMSSTVLQFKKINAGSAKITITDDVANDEVDIDLGSVASTDLSDSGTLYKIGGTDVAVLDGGTGASDASTARSNLGLQIGVNVQAWSAILDATTASFIPTAAQSITGLWNFTGSGLGGITDYDITIGDVTTPDYGMMRIGNSTFGRTSLVTGNLDLDGSIVLWNNGTPATSNIEFAFAESSNSIRFAIPKSGVGNATYNPRSMLIAGPAPIDDTMVTVGYWQGQGIFDNLVCDTSTDGADLGVQNDLEVEGDIFTDSIKESTTAAGVTIDGLLIKDGAIPSLKSCLVIAAGDETTALTVADGKVTFRMPYAYTLTSIRASVTTAPTGASLIADVDLNGTSIMTTNKLEIEVSEKSTKTATTQPTLTTTSLADDDELTVNINQIGSTVAGAGLKVYLIGYPT